MLGVVPSAEISHATDSFRERLARCTRGRFQFGEVVLDYDGPSIGIIAAGDAPMTLEALISMADAAMYASSARGVPARRRGLRHDPNAAHEQRQCLRVALTASSIAWGSLRLV